MNDLTLQPMAIGSLPYKDPVETEDFIFKTFPNTPFWAQLTRVNRLEDMIVQYSENFAGIVLDKENNKCHFDMNQEHFFEQLEQLYLDYDEIVNEKNYAKLDKYSIKSPYSSTFSIFIDKLKTEKPLFAKGHITGPFTWGTSVCDEQDKCAFYDETLKDVIVKTLTLKALWQIKQMSAASGNSKPVIFLDEPAMSQWGTSSFMTVTKEVLVNSFKEISDTIKSHGGLSAIHCCGKADWDVLLEANVDIINLDGYFYAKSLSLYSKSIEKFLKNGGFIAWGIVPTLDKEALDKADLKFMVEKFNEAIKYLVDKGVDKSLIISQSFITPSCGAGSLSEEQATKAMNLTLELSDYLKNEYL